MLASQLDRHTWVSVTIHLIEHVYISSFHKQIIDALNTHDASTCHSSDIDIYLKTMSKKELEGIEQKKHDIHVTNFQIYEYL